MCMKTTKFSFLRFLKAGVFAAALFSFAACRWEEEKIPLSKVWNR